MAFNKEGLAVQLPSMIMDKNLRYTPEALQAITADFVNKNVLGLKDIDLLKHLFIMLFWANKTDLITSEHVSLIVPKIKSIEDFTAIVNVLNSVRRPDLINEGLINSILKTAIEIKDPGLRTFYDTLFMIKRCTPCLITEEFRTQILKKSRDPEVFCSLVHAIYKNGQLLIPEADELVPFFREMSLEHTLHVIEIFHPTLLNIIAERFLPVIFEAQMQEKYFIWLLNLLQQKLPKLITQELMAPVFKTITDPTRIQSIRGCLEYIGRSDLIPKEPIAPESAAYRTTPSVLEGPKKTEASCRCSIM